MCTPLSPAMTHSFVIIHLHSDNQTLKTALEENSSAYSGVTHADIINPLHLNIIAHILHTGYYTFPGMLTRRICLTILSTSFFSMWSFSLLKGAIGIFGFAVLAIFWIGFCAKKLPFLGFGVYYGLRIYRVSACVFRLSRKILTGFWIWYPMRFSVFPICPI